MKTTAIGCTCVITSEAGRVVGVHDVAGVDLPEADATADRRRDLAVGELQLRLVDQRLVDLHGALELADRRLLIVVHLARDDALVEEVLVALQRPLRDLELGTVARHLPLRLRELHLERPRVDLDEQVALGDGLMRRRMAAPALAVCVQSIAVICEAWTVTVWAAAEPTAKTCNAMQTELRHAVANNRFISLSCFRIPWSRERADAEVRPGCAWRGPVLGGAMAPRSLWSVQPRGLRACRRAVKCLNASARSNEELQSDPLRMLMGCRRCRKGTNRSGGGSLALG